jgi:MFS family permease
MSSEHSKLHPDIIKLGVVSFLTDLSSEMIFSVFAIFFTTIAGASTALLGLIEGMADLSASSLNYLAGWLSDRSGKRKVFVVAGYGFSTLAKLILLLSSSIAGLAVFRVVERLGKGFRGAPRDAWLSSISSQATRGYAFGVHKALDKLGAVLGPLVAYALLACLGESVGAYLTLFVVAFVPAVISVWMLTRIPEQTAPEHVHESLSENWQQLNAGFKRLLWPAGLFALGYFSLGFVLLKAHTMGFGVAEIVLLYALLNTTCVLFAPWVGQWSDRVGRRPMVLLGYALYAGISLWLMVVSTRWEMVTLFAAYGLFYAIDESQSKALIADLEPHRRASAVGVYGFVTGVLYLPASLVAGALWGISPGWAFAYSAALSILAMAALVFLRPDAHA